MSEKFEEMVEQYLNFDEFAKEEDDCENIGKKKNSKKRIMFEEGLYIDMDEFVRNYLGINVDAKNLYHSSLKELTCGRLIGLPNEFARQNPKYIREQYLLVVRDGKKNFGTYINPIVLQEYIEAIDYKKIIDKKWTRKFFNNDKKKIINAYLELNKALRVYKMHQSLVNSLNELIAEANIKKKIKKFHDDNHRGGII